MVKVQLSIKFISPSLKGLINKFIAYKSRSELIYETKFEIWRGFGCFFIFTYLNGLEFLYMVASTIDVD